MEFLDALRFPEVRDEEAVAFLRQLVDDVVDRRVRPRDDADGLALRDQGGDEIEDRLRFTRTGRPVDDGQLMCERGSNRVALIDIGGEGHDQSIARARLRGGRTGEERFQGGTTRRLREPFPHVREDRLGQHLLTAHPAGIVGCRVERRPSSSSLRAHFLANVVEGGGVLPILRCRVPYPYFVVPVAMEFKRAVSRAVRERVARIARVAGAAERPDDFDVVPALAADPNLVECVDCSTLDLVVEARPLLAVWKLFAAGGVSDDDALPIAACLRDFPGLVLPGQRFLSRISTCIVRGSTDSMPLPREFYTQDRRLIRPAVGC